jgi:predicted transcriptional regulator
MKTIKKYKYEGKHYNRVATNKGFYLSENCEVLKKDNQPIFFTANQLQEIEIEIEEEEEEEFPKPIFTANIENPESMELLKKYFGKENIDNILKKEEDLKQQLSTKKPSLNI